MIKTYINQITATPKITKLKQLHSAVKQRCERSFGFENTADFKIASLEHTMSKENPVICIDDINVLNFILNLKTVTTEDVIVPSVFPVYSVAFTFDAQVQGVHLPGFLGSIMNSDEFIKSTQTFTQHIGLHQTVMVKETDSSHQMVFIVTGRRNKGSQFSVFSKEALHELLSVDLSNLEESVNLVHSQTPKRKTDIELSFQQKMVSILLARLVINLGIYNQATNNQYLVEGLPERLINKLKSNSLNKDAETYGLVLKVPEDEFLDKEDGSEKSGHFRSGHVRVYRHERFYQNCDLEPGSKWSLVKPSWVKGRVLTQNKG